MVKRAKREKRKLRPQRQVVKGLVIALAVIVLVVAVAGDRGGRQSRIVAPRQTRVVKADGCVFDRAPSLVVCRNISKQFGTPDLLAAVERP